jgi:CRISPR-associated protein Cas5t
LKVIRIILNQSSANYRKEESIENKMTYPLPPLSTVIGAIHSACGYTEYKPMDLSIQGNYGAMHREPYTDYCFLNSVMDDRGILVKMQNETMLSGGFIKVAAAKKSQGNSFKNNITIQTYDKELLKEYQDLRDLSISIKEFKESRIKPLLARIKRRKVSLASKKKKYDKDTIEFKKIQSREIELKALESDINEKVKKYEDTEYNSKISKYRSLTTSLKYYEILDDIHLIIHIRAEECVMEDILNNIYNLKSIGRSEDFVEVIEAKFVELSEEYKEEYGDFESKYSAYLDTNLVHNETIYTRTKDGTNRAVMGTMYYINKNYKPTKETGGMRIFHRKKVIYASGHAISELTENLFMDDSAEEKYIVNFL